MQTLIDSYKKTSALHHAYLLEGESQSIRKQLFKFIENDLKQAVRGNPDVRYEIFETLSIDDARLLREHQSTKTFGTGKKLFIIETVFITLEAQNSLLKMFEEPTPDTHFFIISPSSESFVPTLRSRLMVIRSSEIVEHDEDVLEEFLKASIGRRLKQVADMIEEKDKIKAIGFVDGLIRILKNKISPAVDPALFEELLRARAYLNDRSPSLKLILEHVALITPCLSITIPA